MAELSTDQFNLWRRHPVTELVLDRYLADFSKTLERGVLEAWLMGNLSLQVEQDARGHIHLIRHVQTMRLQALRAFYSVENEAELAAQVRRDSGTGYS